MARGQPQFVHLRARSPYSLLEGAMKIDEVAARCQSWRMPALGLTDTNNLCGALEFSEVLNRYGVQPIMGVTLTLDIGLPLQPGQTRHEPHGTLVLLAQDEAGYENLMALSSAAFLDVPDTDMPHVKIDKLREYTEGLIALSGGAESVLNRLIGDGRVTEAENWLDELIQLYPSRFYIELQRHGSKYETLTERHLVDWAYAKNVPLVATNEPYFLDPGLYKAHDALLAISEGSYVLETDRRRLTPEHYFKSEEQMCELFSDLPEALANTIEIAKRCAYRSVARAPILPGFVISGQSEADSLRAEAKAGLEARLEIVETVDDRSIYFKRLDYELDIINQMGFSGYFLIVADFIKWAKSQDIPVGPGRGSGAGSVVAWALTITDLDPLKYGLLFERFLNPERVSMPDFDIDFCQERRGEVIRYVQEKYGSDQVAHIITFGTLQARAVVRDVGRVLQMPLGQVDRLAKLVPSNPANPLSLSQAIEIEPALKDARDSEPAVRELLDIALKLEGLYRNASTHAAGVVISDRPLVKLVPLYRDPRSDIPATQFSMKWAEKAGLVKFDFLGLKTLTVIDRVKKYLHKQGVEIDLNTLDMRRPEAYNYLADGLSAGIFQLESSGMRDTLRKMAPDSIEELTALISLYRPGPMKNIDTYIERKFGRAEISYPHESLEDILSETYGIIIYQEQVMQIAQTLSGYSLGEADILRRAMGKKDKAEMARQKSRFVDGATERGVSTSQADYIFELVNEFAGYGFNKSHAAAYAVISFQTAYLKSFYPTEFIAAIMSLDIHNVDKLNEFHQEAKRMNVPVRPPCINRSQANFDVNDGEVYYALAALKNVGLEAMRHVVEEREKGGAFSDLFDFARRVDTRIVNKRAFENLARSGAFDVLEPNRAKVLASAPILQSIGARAFAERRSDQNSLFGEANLDMEEPSLPDPPMWTPLETLEQELNAIGFYFTGHPMDNYQHILKRQQVVQVADISDQYAKGARKLCMAGIVEKRQERLSKTNKRYAYLRVSDASSDFELYVHEDLLARHRDILQVGSIIESRVLLDERDGEIKISAQTINSLNMVSEKEVAGLEIRLNSAEPDSLDRLQSYLESFENTPSKIMGYVDIILPLTPGREGQWRVRHRIGIDKEIQKAIGATPHVKSVEEVAA